MKPKIIASITKLKLITILRISLTQNLINSTFFCTLPPKALTKKGIEKISIPFSFLIKQNNKLSLYMTINNKRLLQLGYNQYQSTLFSN